MADQLSWLIRISNATGRDPRDYSYAVQRYRRGARPLYGFMERQFIERDFLYGAYLIADIASWTWIDQYRDQIGGFEGFRHIIGWYERIAARPAVQRGMTVWRPSFDSGWTIGGHIARIASSSPARS